MRALVQTTATAPPHAARRPRGGLPGHLPDAVIAWRAAPAIARVSRRLTPTIWAGHRTCYPGGAIWQPGALRQFAIETAQGLADRLPLDLTDGWCAARPSADMEMEMEDLYDELDRDPRQADWPYILRGLPVSDALGLSWSSWPAGAVSILDLVFGAWRLDEDAAAIVRDYGREHLGLGPYERMLTLLDGWDVDLDDIGRAAADLLAAAGPPYDALPLYARYIDGSTGCPFLDAERDDGTAVLLIPWDLRRIRLTIRCHAEALATLERLRALNTALAEPAGQEHLMTLFAALRARDGARCGPVRRGPLPLRTGGATTENTHGHDHTDDDTDGTEGETRADWRRG